MWQAPEYANTPLALVAAGILASNPHNTQPWIFRVTDTQIDILADTRRHLGTFDPYLREMHLGLGCAVENMALAAAPTALPPMSNMRRARFSTSPGATGRCLRRSCA